jgi:hypothetical protein
VSAERPGPPLSSTATRRQDKVLAIKSASVKAADGASEKPALTLAKAFDSHEATMRLAAMTGMEKELAGFADSARGQSAGSNEGPATRKNPRSKKSAGSAPAARGGGYMWLWIVSIVAILAAAALFLFR